MQNFSRKRQGFICDGERILEETQQFRLLFKFNIFH